MPIEAIILIITFIVSAAAMVVFSFEGDNLLELLGMGWCIGGVAVCAVAMVLFLISCGITLCNPVEIEETETHQLIAIQTIDDSTEALFLHLAESQDTYIGLEQFPDGGQREIKIPKEGTILYEESNPANIRAECITKNNTFKNLPFFSVVFESWYEDKLQQKGLQNKEQQWKIYIPNGSISAADSGKVKQP